MAHSDSRAFSDVPAFFDIVARAGKPRRDDAAAMAANPPKNIAGMLWNGVRPYRGNGRGLFEEEPIHLGSSTISLAATGAPVARSSGPHG